MDAARLRAQSPIDPLPKAFCSKGERQSANMLAKASCE
jgi:hypothetical protein